MFRTVVRPSGTAIIHQDLQICQNLLENEGQLVCLKVPRWDSLNSIHPIEMNVGCATFISLLIFFVDFKSIGEILFCLYRVCVGVISFLYIYACMHAGLLFLNVCEIFQFCFTK